MFDPVPWISTTPRASRYERVHVVEASALAELQAKYDELIADVTEEEHERHKAIGERNQWREAAEKLAGALELSPKGCGNAGLYGVLKIAPGECATSPHACAPCLQRLALKAFDAWKERMK